MGHRRRAYRILAGKPEGKNPHLSDLGVDGRIILKTDLQQLGWEGMDWTNKAQDRCR